MATYGTDLVVLATGSDGESGTWGEFADWDGGGSPGAETENFIQGTQSQSQTFGNPTTGKSIAFDATADISASIPSGDVVMSWVFMGAPTNMYGYATGGHSFGIGSDQDNFDIWFISGDDRSPNPYGGWWNVAIDPEHTPDAYDVGAGTGNGGAWRWFGSIIGGDTLGIRNKISKGYPHAVDGMRMGRGKLYAHGTGGTFTAMATENDYNDVTNGYNRWGLFQDTGGGTYLWKGLMSLGDNNGTSTSLTFTDSNKTIVIDDCPKTYPGFNKIEVTNASSSITWTNISFASKGTYSAGQFEMVDNATVSMTGCAFNNMSTFVFDSNGTVTDSNFNGCGQITAGSATFTGCAINSSTSATSLLAGNNDMTSITGNTFTSDGSNHAVEIDAVGTGSMTWNNTATSYVAGTSGNDVTTTSTGNEAIYLNFTSSATYTINVSTGATVPSVRKGTGMTGAVNIVAGAVSVTVNTVTATGTAVETRVFIETATGGGAGSLPFEDSVSITRSVSTATVTHTAHGLANGDKVVIRGANEREYIGIHTISNVTTNTYDFTVSGTPDTPATGTIVSSFVFISGTTTSGSITSVARTLSADQPIKGTARKSTATPYYKASPIVGTIDTADGLNVTAVMIVDE